MSSGQNDTDLVAELARLAAGKHGGAREVNSKDNNIINEKQRQSPTGNSKLAIQNRLRMENVRRVLEAEFPTIGTHGSNQYTSGGSNTTSTTEGRGRTYTLARLKRDRPDLHARVLDGDLSANAAASEKRQDKNNTSLT